MENYNDWKLQVEKIQDFYSEDYNDVRCCPKKFTWVNETSDSLGNKISRYLPFDAYLIPRNCVEAFIGDYISALPKYGIYCLTGNNVVYCGKATNNDRAKSHIVDTDKANWLWQLLFVPNNKCPNTKTYWNNENFMALLESLMIDKLYQHYGAYFTEKFRNKIPGQDLQKSKDKLNNNKLQIEYAQAVADLMAMAYSDITNDDAFITSEVLNKDWVYYLENKVVTNDYELIKANNDALYAAIKEIQKDAQPLYWPTNTVASWPISDKFLAEYSGLAFKKPYTCTHMHYEFIRHENTSHLDIHLEKVRSLEADNYDLYKGLYARLQEAGLTSTKFEDGSIEGAMKTFAEVYEKANKIIENYIKENNL